MKVLILPNYRQPDMHGDGGIRRVVEAQYKWLPRYDIYPVESYPYDLIILHAGDWPQHEIETQVPIVTHCHGLYWGEYEWDKGATAVNNRVVHNLLRSDRVSCCSEFTARAIRKALWLQPSVLYNGVNPEDWDNVAINDEKPPYVLWNKARVDAVCDPRPVNELAKRLPDVVFMSTFGEPANNVTVTGKVSYQASQMLTKNADVYLGTTRGNFEISVLEAMICGVPVLGWNWGSMSEIIGHKVHGYLAEVGNYDDLVAGYRYIQEHRSAMSRACVKRIVPDFTWERLMKGYAELYLQVVDAHA